MARARGTGPARSHTIGRWSLVMVIRSTCRRGGSTPSCSCSPRTRQRAVRERGRICAGKLSEAPPAAHASKRPRRSPCRSARTAAAGACRPSGRRRTSSQSPANDSGVRELPRSPPVEVSLARPPLNSRTGGTTGPPGTPRWRARASSPAPCPRCRGWAERWTNATTSPSWKHGHGRGESGRWRRSPPRARRRCGRRRRRRASSRPGIALAPAHHRRVGAAVTLRHRRSWMPAVVVLVADHPRAGGPLDRASTSARRSQRAPTTWSTIGPRGPRSSR